MDIHHVLMFFKRLFPLDSKILTYKTPHVF
jgi:hypothetical protein